MYDLIPCGADRYLHHRQTYRNIQFWFFNSPAKTVQRGHELRITALAEFSLHWSADEWRTVADTGSTGTRLGLFYVDIDIDATDARNPSPLRFTFWWTESQSWEGRDYEIQVL